jgi:hypothetical protein
VITPLERSGFAVLQALRCTLPDMRAWPVHDRRPAVQPRRSQDRHAPPGDRTDRADPHTGAAAVTRRDDEGAEQRQAQFAGDLLDLKVGIEQSEALLLAFVQSFEWLTSHGVVDDEAVDLASRCPSPRADHITLGQFVWGSLLCAARRRSICEAGNSASSTQSVAYFECMDNRRECLEHWQFGRDGVGWHEASQMPPSSMDRVSSSCIAMCSRMKKPMHCDSGQRVNCGTKARDSRPAAPRRSARDRPWRCRHRARRAVSPGRRHSYSPR